MDSNAFVLEFTDEQKMLRDMVRKFAEERLRPRVAELDEKEEFPGDLFAEIGELGCTGILVPDDYHGSALGYTEFVIIIEELGRIDPAFALSVAAHNGLCTNHILTFGNPEQKGRLLPGLARGTTVGAWGLTENVSGSDAAGLKTTAIRLGDSYVLNGNKTFTTHGSVADVGVFMAITDKEKGANGISAFIVEKGTPGYIAQKKERKLGMRASDTTQIQFDDCRVPVENLLGREGEGFKQAMKILEGGRITIAALSLGLTKACLEHAIAYAKVRRQFGKSLAEFQSIQFKLADIETRYSAARLLTYKAARMKDSGQNIAIEAAHAKLFSSELAEHAASEAVQIFGGYGYMKDYPVEKLYRDAKLLTIGEGTSEIQRIVISKNELNKIS